ncbi:ankyrin repeat domain-containing protein 35-like [Erpetoichthys calabaricus]|uniref:ankyrin repeat domain-containing protein 35-like n=1 Tax=Erpetoichthys calabaricus TaxID=27687 RepID=UPI00223407D6|nr:ankyrin repeat domain-containing protein 35-like [Erpetoichthys calabaricus]
MKKFFSCSTSPLGAERWGKDDQKLLKAVDKGDVNKVSAVLSRRTIKPTKLDEQGRSSFHMAAMRGAAECLELMLTHGADLHARDDNGCSALHLAAKYGQPDCIKALIQHGIPVDLTDNTGRTALHYTAQSGCVPSSSLLCSNGAPVNKPDRDGLTALMIAAQENQQSVCEELLQHGADVNTTDHLGRTALILGCMSDSVQAVAVLLRHGADSEAVDSMGLDAAHYLKVSGSEEIVSLLRKGQQKLQAAGSSDEESSHLSQKPCNTTEEIKVNSANRGSVSDCYSKRLEEDKVAVEEEVHVAQSPRKDLTCSTDTERHRQEEEWTATKRLRTELSLKRQECEYLTSEIEALRGQLWQQTQSLSLLLLNEGVKIVNCTDAEEEEEEGEGELIYNLLMERLARLLQEKKQQVCKYTEIQKGEDTSGKNRRHRESVEAVDVQQQQEVLNKLKVALEDKANSEKRILEIEGHLDNMRAVLSQYETRKRMQSSVIEELELQVSESATENETLKMKLQELQSMLETERHAVEESISYQEYRKGKEALAGTILELRGLLSEMRVNYSEALKEKEEKCCEIQLLQLELDSLKQRLQSDFIPVDDYRRRKKSWEGTVNELEKLALKLSDDNRNLQTQWTHSKEAQENESDLRIASAGKEVTSLSNAESLSCPTITVARSESNYETVKLTVSKEKGIKDSLKKDQLPKQNVGNDPNKDKVAQTQDRSEALSKDQEFIQGLFSFLFNTLEQNACDMQMSHSEVQRSMEPIESTSYPIAKTEDSNERTTRNLETNTLEGLQSSLDYPEFEKMETQNFCCASTSVKDETNSRKKEFLNDGKILVDDENNLKHVNQKLSSTCETETALANAISENESLKEHVVSLEEDLAAEQQVSKKLQSNLEAQKNEIRALKEAFPPEILKEDNREQGMERGNGDKFDSDIIEELYWNIGCLVKRYQECESKVWTANFQEKEHINKSTQTSQEIHSSDTLASEFSEALTKIKELEIDLGKCKNETVSKEAHMKAISSLEIKVNSLQEEIELMEGHLEKGQTELSCLQDELNHTYKEVTTLEARERQRLEETASLEKQAQVQVMDLLQKYEQSLQETASWKDCAQKELDLSQEMKNRVSALERQADEAEYETQRMTDRVFQMQTQVEQWEKKYKEKQYENTNLQEQLERLMNLNTSFQQEVASLQNHLEVLKTQHQEVISVYRYHLLSAAQGMMDKEIHLMLLKIHNLQRKIIY